MPLFTCVFTLRRTRRSMLMDSGMVRISSYPLAAATIASPMPVLPLCVCVCVWRMVMEGRVWCE
jgi:hypothetical protein